MSMKLRLLLGFRVNNGWGVNEKDIIYVNDNAVADWGDGGGFYSNKCSVCVNKWEHP